MADPDPVDEVDGLADDGDVSKPGFRAYSKASTLGVFPTAQDVRDRDLSGRTRIMIGSRFFRKDTSDVAADDMTEESPVIIDGVGNHWVLVEGEFYAVAVGLAGLISDGEESVPHIFPTPVEAPAELPGSLFRLRVAADAIAVFEIWRYDFLADAHVQLGTITFAIGALVGVVVFADDVAFVRYDEIYTVSPDPRNQVLRTFYGTFALRR